MMKVILFLTSHDSQSEYKYTILYRYTCLFGISYRGLVPVIEYINSKGLKFGLVSMYMYVYMQITLGNCNQSAHVNFKVQQFVVSLFHMEQQDDQVRYDPARCNLEVGR